MGIGAQKAGTTWWFGLVASHPGVAHRDDIHKERHFFNRFAARSIGSEECARYHAWFPRPVGMVTGEWTPDYLHLSWVPPLLAEAAPQARLLVLLRDPVERFRSGLADRRGHWGALDRRGVCRRAGARVLRSGVGGMATSFPTGADFDLAVRALRAGPAGRAAENVQLPNLPPFIPDGTVDRVNESRAQLTLPDDARRRLCELYAPDVLALSASTSEIDTRLWPNFSSLIRA